MKKVFLLLGAVALVVMLALVAVYAVWQLRSGAEDVVVYSPPVVVRSPVQLSVASPTPSLSPVLSPSPSPAPRSQTAIDAQVPFTPQAPLAQWSDPDFQNACEEASILMVQQWLAGESMTSPQETTQAIAAIISFEEAYDGISHDRSAPDTAKLFREYTGHQNVRLTTNAILDDLRQEIRQGNILIVSVNGRLLGNPFFTLPGPERHMLVIKGYDGYDQEAREFITNDPGTRRGANYRYDENVLYQAIRDYPTGDNLPITKVEKNMIVIGK